MSAGGVKDLHLIVAAGVLTVLLAGAAAVIDPPDGQGGPGASSFSAAAEGGRAAFYTLKQLGYDIERSFEPMTAIRADPARTTLLVTGANPPSEQDRHALRSFVDTGGVVLLVGSAGASFVDVVTPPAASRPPGRPSVHRVLAASPLAAGTSEISMTRTGGTPKFGPEYVAVFAVSADEPLVATARIGQGRVIWWAAPTPLVNAHITAAANLQLLLNVAGAPGARRLLWDEHYHGYSRSIWSYAAGTPVPWIAAQGGLILIAAVAAYSRRRGPVRSIRTDPRTSPLEFIDMLGALYRRAGANGAAVASARTRLTRTVSSACGMPHDAGDDAIARAVASKTGASLGEIIDILAASDRARRDPALTEAEALKLTRRLQLHTAAVLGA